MENLFNNPFFIKLQTFGQKLGTNKFLSSLQAAMMSSMGIIMVGAIFQIICALGTMFNLFAPGDQIYAILNLPYEYTMNLLSIYVVVFMALNYAKNLKMKSPISSAVDSIVCFLIATNAIQVVETAAGSNFKGINTTFLGATGMFVGFITVLVVVRIEKLCIDKNIRVKMPDVCPQFLVDGFSSIIPLLLNVILFTVINTILTSISGGALNIATLIIALLSAPLRVLVSVPGMFVLGIVAALLWCLGIHGTMIVYSVIAPLLIQASQANAAAFAAGGVEAVEFYPVMLFGAVAMCGGTGNTLPLVLMGLRSKSKQIRSVAKVSLLPGWFNVNEPVTFGMPIMYNPILCIPYVLNVPVVMTCMLILFKTGFLTPAYITIMSLMPMGFSAYFSTLSIKNALADYLMLIPSGLIWYPFFKVYEKQLIAKEAVADAE